MNIEDLVKICLSNKSPELNKLIELAKQNNVEDLQNYARDYCSKMGINFDEAFPAFVNQFNKKNINSGTSQL